MPFERRYEFCVSGTRSPKDPRTFVCCDGGMAHQDGEASLRFSLETRYPDTFDFTTGEATPARTVEHGGQTVYSYALVTTKRSNARGGAEYRKSDEPWLLREMVIALARGDVGGRSAGSMLYTVFWHTVAKQGPSWLTENAPEWWALIDPKRHKQEDKEPEEVEA